MSRLQELNGSTYEANLTRMTSGYLSTMMSLTDDGPNDSIQLDDNYRLSDLDKTFLEQARNDCSEFLHHLIDGLYVYSRILSIYVPSSSRNKYSLFEMAGGDFYLTRERHGSGFWDKDTWKPIAKELTEIAHLFSEGVMPLLHDSRPFWYRHIDLATLRGFFSVDEKRLSANWVTCACGQVDPHLEMIEDDSSNGPKDNIIRGLGVDFHMAVSCDYFEAAMIILKKIDRRAGHLMPKEVSQ